MNKDALLDKLTQEYNWSPGTFEIWQKANFQCSYCNRDFFQSLDSYKQAKIDHLLPQSLYPEFVNEKLNLVLSCEVCNNLKRNDVRCFEGFVLAKKGEITEEDRDELLPKARRHVREQRLKREQKFLEEKKLVWEWMMAKN